MHDHRLDRHDDAAEEDEQDDEAEAEAEHEREHRDGVVLMTFVASMPSAVRPVT